MDFQTLVDNKVSELTETQEKYYDALKELLKDEGFYNPSSIKNDRVLKFKCFDNILTILIEINLSKITINYESVQNSNNVYTAKFESLLIDLQVTDVYDLLKSTIFRFLIDGELDEKLIAKFSYKNKLIDFLPFKNFKENQDNWLIYHEGIGGNNTELYIKVNDYDINIVYKITKQIYNIDVANQNFHKKSHTPKELSEIILKDFNNLKNTLDIKSLSSY